MDWVIGVRGVAVGFDCDGHGAAAAEGAWEGEAGYFCGGERAVEGEGGGGEEGMGEHFCLLMGWVVEGRGNGGGVAVVWDNGMLGWWWSEMV